MLDVIIAVLVWLEYRHRHGKDDSSTRDACSRHS
jgi:hypothetical protein